MTKETTKEPSSKKSKLKFSLNNALKNFTKNLLKLFPKNFYHKKYDEFQKSLNNFRSLADTMNHSEKEILINLLNFGDKNISQIIVPRSDICAIDINKSIIELSNLVIENGHTRTIIYSETLDNIEGFVHIRDLFKSVHEKRAEKISDILRKPVIAAPSMKLIDLFAEMQRKRTHIAVVIDEYGGTLGMVTIEDIMEEIFGSIHDEHDTELEKDEDYFFTSEGNLVTSSRVSISDVEKLLMISLKYINCEADTTIGGLVLSRAGFMPSQGDIIDITDSLSAKILEASPRSLKKLKLIKR